MFNKKQNHLIEGNSLSQEDLKASSETLSGNGAMKYTSGDAFVDNFASISKFKKPRSFDEVSADMQELWGISPENTVKLALYIRLITRKSQVIDGDESVKTLDSVQRGQGLKHEGIMRMMWLAINQPDTFKENFPLMIAAGSWKDVIAMMSIDLQYNGWDGRMLDWNFLRDSIMAGLLNPGTTQLVRKYLPTIRTNAKSATLEAQADTLIGRWLAKQLFPKADKAVAYKQYRQLKAQGTAHEWQQLISKQLYDKIDFDKIAGRALAQLVGSKFLENHNLVDRYFDWIKSKPVAKFTGFVYELLSPLNDSYSTKHIDDYREHTINAQFNGLIQTAKEGNTVSKLLVVRDTSGSMTATAAGCNVSSFNIAKAMALYFSEFLEGPFADCFAEFSDECILHKWKGKTPVDKYVNDDCTSYGSTNFQSVIDLFINLKIKGVSESDFPEGILCISDGEFDTFGNNKSTNFNTAISRLREAGFSEEYVNNFKIILWDIPNSFYGRVEAIFEDFADAPNFFYMSGFDPAAVSFLFGKDTPAPKNAEELFEAAMNQELLNSVVIPGK